MRFWNLGLFLFVSIGCVEKNDSDSASGSVPEGVATQTEQSIVEPQEISVVTFRNDTLPGGELQGWGFDLYKNGKRFIHQPMVPVVSGNVGFESEVQAQRAGQLVSDKIKNGIMPPALDESDLKALGVHLP